MNAERIVFVPFIHAFAGVERLILGLSRFLHENGATHTVVCFSQTIDFASYANWPLTVHELAPMRNPVAEGWALHRYLWGAYGRGSPPALLFDLKAAFYAGMFPAPGFHLHLTDPPGLLPADISKCAPSFRKVYPSFKRQQCPSLMDSVHGEIVHRINRRGVKSALSVIAMSDAIAAELRAVYSVEPKIVRPGVLLSPRSAFKRFRTDKLRILSVCRLEPNKRVDWILHALADLQSRSSLLSKATAWTFDVVGGGSQEKQLQALASQLGISEKVVFHGAISDARLEELFADSTLFLMPAAQGYGLPALEALARGVPVVLHRESGVSEVLNETLWAAVISDGIERLAGAINTMLDRIRDGEISKSPVPAFPTESGWAREISTVCQWI
jgi:glycosyltransferase involved in cell wall biosynthesis